MTTPPISHRPNPVAAVAAAGLVAVLMAAPLTNANAMPGRDDSPGVPGRSVHTDADPVEHACFITPPSWNEGLDGPLPRC